jgi:cell division septation protein DedD
MQTLGQLSRLEQDKVGEPEKTEGPLSQSEKQRRIVVYTLNATLVAGLLLAFAYLGARILETRAAATTALPQAVPTKPQPQAPAVAKPVTVPAPTKAAIAPVAARKEQTTPLKRYAGPVVEPKAGETYLQIGAYGPTFTHSFVEELKGKGFQPVVAQGPADDVYRVMIGPLNRDSLKITQAQVEQAEIAGAMVRQY